MKRDKVPEKELCLVNLKRLEIRPAISVGSTYSSSITDKDFKSLPKVSKHTSFQIILSWKFARGNSFLSCYLKEILSCFSQPLAKLLLLT